MLLGVEELLFGVLDDQRECCEEDELEYHWLRFVYVDVQL